MSVDLTSHVGQSESDVLSADALLLMADDFLSDCDYLAACSCLNKALFLSDSPSSIYIRLGYVKYCAQEYTVAMEYYQRVENADVEFPELKNYLGLLYLAKRNFLKSEKYFLSALTHVDSRTTAQLNLANLALLQENYQSGWEYYSLFFQSREALTPESLGGKSVLITGDTSTWQELFFLRFLPVLRQCGVKKIYYKGSERFRFLLNQGIEGVNILKIPPIKAQYDVILPISQIPEVISKLSSITTITPLSFGEPTAFNLKTVRNLLPQNGRENIAISWDSTSTESLGGASWGVKNRISPELLGETLRYSQANILVLQRNASIQDIRLLEKGLRRKVFNYSFIHDSIDDVYAFLSEMNQYISMGDYPVHLALGLDVKISVLLSNPPQWQWLANGNQSPWFPDVSLYRQNTSGSWSDACHELSHALCD